MILILQGFLQGLKSNNAHQNVIEMIQGLKLKLVLSTESPFLGKVASHKFGRLAPTYTALQKREQH